MEGSAVRLRVVNFTGPTSTNHEKYAHEIRIAAATAIFVKFNKDVELELTSIQYVPSIRSFVMSLPKDFARMLLQVEDITPAPVGDNVGIYTLKPELTRVSTEDKNVSDAQFGWITFPPGASWDIDEVRVSCAKAFHECGFSIKTFKRVMDEVGLPRNKIAVKLSVSAFEGVIPRDLLPQLLSIRGNFGDFPASFEASKEFCAWWRVHWRCLKATSQCSCGKRPQQMGKTAEQRKDDKKQRLERLKRKAAEAMGAPSSTAL